MASFDKTEMKAYFDQLVEATKNGAMNWIEINPSTFSWDTATPVTARLTMQVVPRQIQVRQPNGQIAVRQAKAYLFQAFQIQGMNQKVRLSVNGTEDDAVNDQLEALYEAIQSSVSKQSLDFLKSILPPKDIVSS